MLTGHLRPGVGSLTHKSINHRSLAPSDRVASCRAHLYSPSAQNSRRPISWGPNQQQLCQHSRGSVVARVAQRSLVAILSEVEELKASADLLESELAEVSKAAEVAAKRSRRLAARSHELQEYALEHVMLGDEPAARAALLQKAAVADALRHATRRAEANSALARRLEEILMLKQSRLLALIREGNRQQAAAAAASTAGSPGAAAERQQVAPARGLRRSRSVAWSSRTLHASSDGFSETAEVAAAAAEAAAAAARAHARRSNSSHSRDLFDAASGRSQRP